MSASGSVIHDLGYRRYQGERAGVGPIAWSMYVTGLRNVFGLGRSGKSKIMPFLLLGLNLAPAAILVAVVVMVHLASLPRSYAEYAGSTQVLSAVFAGAQAPILFSRDIRSGAISLYLARPLGSAAYALCRWASLTTALFGFLLLPILVLYLGAILAEFDVAEESVDAAGSVLLALLLAGMLASVSAVISSVSIRRGFAVVATIAVLMFGDGVVTLVQAVGLETDHATVGQLVGLLSPYAIYRGLVDAFDLGRSAIVAPDGTGMEILYLAAALLIVLGGIGLLMLRYRKVAGR